MARALGLGAAVGSDSALARAVRRLERFGLIVFDNPVVRVHTEVPPLTNKDVARLPESLRALHDQLTRRRTPDGPGSD
jgi:hypothetical protein